MNRRRQGLIMGHAALFAASIAGCDGSAESDTVGTDHTTQSNIPRDANSPPTTATMDDATIQDRDMLSAMDGSPGVADMLSAQPRDQGTLPDVSQLMDVAIVDIDRGPVETDSGLFADASVVSDAALVEDAERPIDAEPPIPDVAAGGVCDNFIGQRCGDFNQGCCENNEPVLVCRGNRFVQPGPDEFACGCSSANGPTEVFCAVPGFVGIAKAGRIRRNARRLRSLFA